jgi:hypothetical protein
MSNIWSYRQTITSDQTFDANALVGFDVEATDGTSARSTKRAPRPTVRTSWSTRVLDLRQEATRSGRCGEADRPRRGQGVHLAVEGRGQGSPRLGRELVGRRRHPQHVRGVLRPVRLVTEHGDPARPAPVGRASARRSRVGCSGGEATRQARSGVAGVRDAGRARGQLDRRRVGCDPHTDRHGQLVRVTGRPVVDQLVGHRHPALHPQLRRQPARAPAEAGRARGSRRRRRAGIRRGGAACRVLHPPPSRRPRGRGRHHLRSGVPAVP